MAEPIKEKTGKYLLSNDVEDVLSKMNISGGNAWEMMHSYLTSTLEVEYKGETTTLSAIRKISLTMQSGSKKRGL